MTRCSRISRAGPVRTASRVVWVSCATRRSAVNTACSRLPISLDSPPGSERLPPCEAEQPAAKVWGAHNSGSLGLSTDRQSRHATSSHGPTSQRTAACTPLL